MKKKKILIITAVVLVLGAIVLGNSLYTVRENEYACVTRFNKIEFSYINCGILFRYITDSTEA